MTTFAKSIAMDSKLTEDLGRLKAKIEILAAQKDNAISRLQASALEIESLKEKNRELAERLRKCELDVEYLSFSHKLADNPAAIAGARELLNGLIRKVNKALAMLESDAEI